jgi:hypothetical protein
MKKNTLLGFEYGAVCNVLSTARSVTWLFSWFYSRLQTVQTVPTYYQILFTPSNHPDSTHLLPNSSDLSFKIITAFDATQVTVFTKTGNVHTTSHAARSRNHHCHEHETMFPLYCCWRICGCQQYKSVQCLQGNATIRSLCTAVELQNISYCCQQ